MNRFYVDPTLVVGTRARQRYDWICALSRRLRRNLSFVDIVQETIRGGRSSPFHDLVNVPTTAEFTLRGQVVAVRNAIRGIRFIPLGIHTTRKYRALVSAKLNGRRQLIPVSQLVRLIPQYREVLKRAASFRDSWQAHRTALMFLYRVPVRITYWRPRPPPRPRRRRRP